MYADTISAIATPLGEGGIGIVRISGPDADQIASRIFRRGRSLRPVDVAQLESHRLYYGYVVDPRDERVVDEVLLARMAAPRSYTREDVVEISCHGGPLVVREVLRLTLAAGARQAEPGEFTLRAFLNGRIDLAQAEAVMAVVSARTPDSLDLAVGELRGRMVGRLGPAREALIEALAYLDASADFPEDEVPPLDLTGTLARAEAALDEVVAGAQLGLLYREGVQIAIVGRPNVGKSSLLNALLRAERAIVTDIAGTTRDVIAESINLQGIPATLIDTAGIADTEDIIERMGIDRSRRALDTAGLAIFVLDGSMPPTPDDFRVAELLQRRVASDGHDRLVLVLNKRDLPDRHDHDEIRALLPGAPVVEVSTRTGEGIAQLEATLAEALIARAAEGAAPALVTLRQQQALTRALESIRQARAALDAEIPLDLVAVDVRDALLAVGEITGEQVSETILDEIFARFCIGK
ncbi:tRNA uridine-5-carboxymethylaminomethyl(34) synthesis GTPase MnmE [Sphaerobacter thermophilus]|uniref:tRNA uridine-5-carboxymethylaminomethyl(34) synthesis GTPase MnmE n=1 Tax=Sphaerobacter thermophilus TaxID=2057 RepID=UPI0039C38120